MKVFVRLLVVALALMAVAVPSAVAASPAGGENCPTQGMTAAQLQAALANPMTEEYCPAEAVEGAKAGLAQKPTQAQPVQAATVGGSDKLPFTGAELVTFLTVGSALIVTGFVLRRSGRAPSDS